MDNMDAVIYGSRQKMESWLSGTTGVERECQEIQAITVSHKGDPLSHNDLIAIDKEARRLQACGTSVSRADTVPF